MKKLVSMSIGYNQKLLTYQAVHCQFHINYITKIACKANNMALQFSTIILEKNIYNMD